MPPEKHRTHSSLRAAARNSAGTLLLAAGLAVSCSSARLGVFVAPDVPGAHAVGNAACMDCHSNYVQAFAASPHARLDDSRGGGCESCHGPGSLHVAAGGGRGRYIVNPGKDPSACFQCHLETHAQFELPQHHPVPEGHMNCVQCHDPHGLDILKPAGGLAMARVNESCAQCHREQTQPVVFEHEALREGCIACHSPHGSINRKLLTQGDANLCLRCHAQLQSAPGSGEIFIGGIPHTTFLMRAACWASGCHTAVHGSNVDPRLRY
ncbi:MAG: cytochrome c3 family protein [Verrucomicrobiota bacterium]